MTKKYRVMHILVIEQAVRAHSSGILQLAGVPNVRPVWLVYPRFAAVNCLLIDANPVAKLTKALLKNWHNAPGMVGPDIQQHVSTARNCTRQLCDYLLQWEHVRWLKEV